MAGAVKFHGTRQRLVGGGLPFFGLAGGVLGGGGGGDPTALWNVDIVEQGSTARTSQPFSFGVPIGPGDFDSATQKIVVYDGETALADAQFTCECADQAGDVRWVRIDGVLPALSSAETKTLSVKAESGSQAAGTPITAADLQAFINDNAAGGDVRVAMVVSGTTYTASVKAMLDSTKTAYAAAEPHYRGAYFAGPMASCYVGSVPLEDGGGARASDYLRVDFHVYGWKETAGGAIVGAKVDAIVWNSAYDPAAFGDVAWTSMVLEYGDGTDIEAYTTAGGSTGVAYARSRFKFDDLWVGLSGAEKGSWEAVHETESLKLQKVFDNQWMLDHWATSDNVSAKLASLKSGQDAVTLDPFRSKGVHVQYHMGNVGGRYEIGYLTQGQVMAACCWNDGARGLVNRAAREALHIPWVWRDQTTGVLVAPSKTSANINNDTSPSPNATPWWAGSNYLDVGHQPNDHFLPAMLYGDFWLVEALHEGAHYAWMAITNGTGYNRRLSHGIQDRGAAWAMRSVTAAIALTPNALSADLTGWSRANWQSWMDAAVGTAGGTATSGFYHGAKSYYWDATQAGAIPVSGYFDNDDPDSFRWLYHSSDRIMRQWGAAFYLHQMAWGKKLNIGNGDHTSWLEWLTRLHEQFLEDPRYQWLLGYYKDLGDRPSIGHYPRNKDEAFRDLTVSFAIYQEPYPVLRTYTEADMANLGITGATATWSATTAVTLALTGASAVDYFEHTADATYFTRARPCPIKLVGWGAGGADAIGKITSVANGKTVVVDFQADADCVDIDTGARSSGESIVPPNLFLPMPAKDASWLGGETILGASNNDYTLMMLGALEALADVGYNTGTYAANRAKLVAWLHAAGQIASPTVFPSSTDDATPEWWFKGTV
jgi:hypothetical protein